MNANQNNGSENLSRQSEAAAERQSGGYYPVIIIGGGHAGLSISHCLKERGIDHLIFLMTTEGALHTLKVQELLLPGNGVGR